jgi:hypothetical protein
MLYPAKQVKRGEKGSGEKRRKGVRVAVGKSRSDGKKGR